jgi:hypothetical protein
MSIQRGADVAFGWLRNFSQKRGEHNGEAGRTITALEGILLAMAPRSSGPA